MLFRFFMSVVVLCIAFPCDAADKIMLDDVLKSSAQYFPAIQMALAEYDEQQGKITESLGAFDRKIEGSYYDRMTGFYEGGIAGAEFVQPFQDYNAKLSLGYRRSEADFPIYEDYFYTNDGGEFNGKLSLSLLRNRDIDPKRFKLFQNRIALEQTELQVLATQLSVQADAYKAYLEWLSAGLEYRVYQSLLRIATQRQDALTERHRRGDIAEIALTENRQFILQRKEILRQTERRFENASNRLSMFMRDDVGDPYNIGLKNLPEKFPSDYKISVADMDKVMGKILYLNPAVRQLEFDLEQAETQIALGQNNTKPAVDLELGFAKDTGEGEIRSNTRDEFDTTARIDVSFPLQTRFGQGQTEQGRARKRKLEHQRNLELERLRVTFENIIENVMAARDLLNITNEEISVAGKMERAERRRFENGQSDFFLVNIREVNTANAKINNIKAQRYLAGVYADYYVAVLDDENLGLNLPGLPDTGTSDETGEALRNADEE